jgi:hypothetical protein
MEPLQRAHPWEKKESPLQEFLKSPLQESLKSLQRAHRVD